MKKRAGDGGTERAFLGRFRFAAALVCAMFLAAAILVAVVSRPGDPSQTEHWILIGSLIAVSLVASVLALLLDWKGSRDRRRDAMFDEAVSVGESERKYRLLFENLTAGFALHKMLYGPGGEPLDYRFVEINQAFERLTGLKAAETVGRTVLEILPKTERYWIEEYGKVASGGAESMFENWSGELGKYYQVRAYSPEPGFFAVIVEDITERKAMEASLRASEERYRRIIEGITNYVYTVRVEGGKPVSTVHSDACLAVTGYSPAEFAANPYLWLDMIAEEDRNDVVTAIGALIEGGPVPELEHRIRRKDGETRWIRDVVVPHFGNGMLLSYDGVVTDVTARRVAEERLQSLNADLERQVAQRTEELSSSNRELEAFAFSVSHDLRAPLRAIEGFSAILEEEHAKGLDGEGKRVLGIVRDNVRRMDALISDLLSVSRVAMITLRRDPVDMEGLARGAWAEIGQGGATEGFELSVSPLPRATGDRTLLFQVWVNLLSNAVKYSKDAAARRIEVEGKAEGSWVSYRVRDRGAGFDPKYRDRLFIPFQRLHSKDQFDGNGVGLAIVQRIVARHGGRVFADGSPGGGATFGFDLPAEEASS